MGTLRRFSALLAPPRCAGCGRACGADETVCGRCLAALGRMRPLRGRGAQGVDSAWSSAAHEGVARDLVAALKFGRLLAAARPMAERIERLAPASLLSGALVPLPSAPARSLLRGFDPATELAAALAALTGLPLEIALGRAGGGRQLGRRRAERLGRPPRIRARGEPPRSVVLVDDVLTTGATVSAAARALRRAGAVRIVAVTFTRRL